MVPIYPTGHIGNRIYQQREKLPAFSSLIQPLTIELCSSWSSIVTVHWLAHSVSSLFFVDEYSRMLYPCVFFIAEERGTSKLAPMESKPK